MATRWQWQDWLGAALFLGGLLFSTTPVLSGQHTIGKATDVVGRVFGDTLNKTMRTGDPVRFGQRVRTGADSAAELTFIDDSTVMMGARAELILDEFVYDPEKKKLDWIFRATDGLIRFTSSPRVTQKQVTIHTPYIDVGIRGTAFDLMTRGRETEIAVHEGVVEVTADTGRQTVKAGEVYTVNADGRGEMRLAMSEEMRGAIQGMLGLLGKMDRYGKAAGSQTALLHRAAQPWDSEIKGRPRERILILDTGLGSVLIEMNPRLAPAHVGRMQRLVRMGFYDGKPFYSVKPGFAVEAGEPDGDGAAAGIAVPLPAELSGQAVERGVVGMVHPAGEVNGATSRFFIALGRLSHLDGKYTVWGRVIYGLDTLDKLKPGDPPAIPDTIVSLRMLSDITN